MANGNTETLTVAREAAETLNIDAQFVQMNEYIDALRHPEVDDSKEIERVHTVKFESGDQGVEFASPFRRAASISIEYPDATESHSFFVDTAQQTVRRTIWRAGRIAQSDLVLSRPEALIATREYPSTETEGGVEPRRLDAEEALQLLTIAHTALSGLRRALAE